MKCRWYILVKSRAFVWSFFLLSQPLALIEISNILCETSLIVIRVVLCNPIISVFQRGNLLFDSSVKTCLINIFTFGLSSGVSGFFPTLHTNSLFRIPLRILRVTWNIEVWSSNSGSTVDPDQESEEKNVNTTTEWKPPNAANSLSVFWLLAPHWYCVCLSVVRTRIISPFSSESVTCVRACVRANCHCHIFYD